MVQYIAMFIDEVQIVVIAGKGGDGAVSFRRTGQTAKGGPDGGNGGKGGDLYVQGTSDLTALRQFQFKKKHTAENGVNGGKNNLYGRKGEDLTLKLPIGTSVIDSRTGEEFEIINDKDVLLIAKGGEGGRGNNEFKTSINQAPRYAELGAKGEEKVLDLKLRLIADIGLIGLPNAGKSSLLEALTDAHPKIGNYSFTTLEPNLGVMQVGKTSQRVILADIPGLIEGASTGKGLGIKFLKHIEKTHIICHCIDSGEEDPEKIYKIVRREFSTFNKLLLDKKEIILLTKSDTVDEKVIKSRKKTLSKINNDIIVVSVYNDIQLENLKNKIIELLEDSKNLLS